MLYNPPMRAPRSSLGAGACPGALPVVRFAGVFRLLLLSLPLTGCGSEPWNNPYPEKEEGSVYYDSFGERPKHLDPAVSYSSDEYRLIGQVYEPPLQYHLLLRPYQLVPLTVREVPAPVLLDADLRELPPGAAGHDAAYSVYRLRLREGLRYQPHPALARSSSGEYLYHALSPAELRGKHRLSDFPSVGSRELVAADYVYQVKRLASPETPSPVYGLMSEHIVGLKSLREGLNAALEEGEEIDLRSLTLEGVRVTGRYSYEIRLRGYYPAFVYWLAMPFFSPMPWEAESFYGQPGMRERNLVLDWYPIGTGPYMLTENNPNLRMVLSRNPHYRRETYPARGMPGDREAGLLADAGRPLPLIDRAVFSREPENIPAWTKFLQGYYDVSGISSDHFDQAVQFLNGQPELTEELRSQGIRLDTAVQNTIIYMGFNMKDPVVGASGDAERARKLRQAISIALDQEEYISIFLNGRGVVAHGPIPPGIFGYREGPPGVNPVTHEWRSGEARRRPLGEAWRLLEEAGYPGGMDGDAPLVLYFDTLDRGPDTKDLHEWYIKQFNRLGVQLVPRVTDYNRFREKMRNGAAQIFTWGWHADYPDPENFLFLLHGKNRKVDDDGENAANYQSPEYDRLFEQVRYMENGPARGALIERMLSIARRDAPWIWGFYPVSYTLYHSWYGNTRPNLVAHNTLKYRRVDPRRRALRRTEWNRPVLWPLWVVLALLALAALPAVRTYRARERERAL